MSTLETPDVDLIEWTNEEYQAAVDSDLEVIGMSYDELRQQAGNEEFTTDRARRLWFAIKPLVDADNQRPRRTLLHRQPNGL